MSEFYPYNYKGYPTGLKYPWIFPMPSKKEGDRRWLAIRKSMRKHHVDCLIVSAPFGYMPSHHQLPYISNYMPFSNRGTYVVFPLEGESLLAVSTYLGPQFLHIATETSWIKDILASPSPVQDIIRKVKQLKLEHGRLGIVGYRSGVFQASVYDTLRESLPTATFEDASLVLGEAMDEVSRSSEEEVTLLRKACEILDLSYQAVTKTLKPGVREYELWTAAEQAIVNNGGWYPHFMIVTSGPRPIFHRAPPSHNILNPGDVVMFEINVTYGGITPQISYALSLGRPEREVEEMFAFCRELYDYSLVELEKKRTFMDIEQDLASRLHGAGYEPMTPQIHRYNMSGPMPMASPPQPGDYFTVHPNVCSKDYTAGAKFGDAVRITKEGKVERLQTTPPKLNII
jgi:Xaa-Pro dipeptidase